MPDYIHGFSLEEQKRLIQQAAVLAPRVFDGLDVPPVGRLLELGCGVGAELRRLARLRPQLRLLGLDRSPIHLAAAHRLLGPLGERVSLVRADARRLPFRDRTFDRVLTVWMLEHVGDAAAVIREALRALRPEGRLVCTEVDNATFGFDPPQPAIDRWWASFNGHQVRAGGDPYVGQRLAAIARRLGAIRVRSEALTVISSRRFPHRRQTELDYLQQLLLSGADSMGADGKARAGLRRAFDHVRRNPEIHFEYSAVRMSCGRGPID